MSGPYGGGVAGERLHLEVSGRTHRELGLSRGRALRSSLGAAYERYAALFRAVGVPEDAERDGVGRAAAVIAGWRPAVLEELAGVAEGAGVEVEQVIALNARTEILAARSSHECSALTALIDGRRYGAQTWDWHIELDGCWHTHEVAGPGHRYAGLTEEGILSKIGVNEAGLALHFNLLKHVSDGADGVPMHVLSRVVLAECATVDEALTVVRSAPIGSSSALTLLDTTTAVSAELSPVGVFVIAERDGSVQRTNHFRHPIPLAGQRDDVEESQSSARLELLRSRLAAGLPATLDTLVKVLLSGEDEAPLCCVPDMSLEYGERVSTLATILTDPAARTVRVLDGMPTRAAGGPWRVISL